MIKNLRSIQLIDHRCSKFNGARMCLTLNAKEMHTITKSGEILLRLLFDLRYELKLDYICFSGVSRHANFITEYDFITKCQSEGISANMNLSAQNYL